MGMRCAGRDGRGPAGGEVVRELMLCSEAPGRQGRGCLQAWHWWRLRDGNVSGG
jgi:hypothetical protein